MTRSALSAALLALLLALAVPAVAGAVVLPADATVAISGTPDLQSLFPTPAGSSFSSQQAVAVRADGHVLVVFTSLSDGLVADDDDSVQNVYVKDVTTGEVQLVSRQSNVNGVPGEPAHADCFNGAISADGHAVAFVCAGSLDPVHDQNGKQDVYERNLDTGQTTLVSRAVGGMAGNGGVDALIPAVAHAGGSTYVAFDSSSTDLVTPATDGNSHVFRRILGPGDAMQLVDQAVQANLPSISTDGQKVAFVTPSALDAVDDTNSTSDLYVRDFSAAGAPAILMSRADGAGSMAADQGAAAGSISPDGSTVAFETRGKLNRPDTDNSIDVYLRSGTTTTLASIGANGQRAGADCFVSGVTGSGANAVVAFASATTAFDSAVTSTAVLQGYVSRVVGGTREVELVSRGAGAGPPSAAGVPTSASSGLALSGDGTKVAVSLFGGITGDADPSVGSVVLRDLGSGAVQTVSRPAGGAPFVNAGGSAQGGAVSADGRYVAFASSAPALGLPAGSAFAVYRRDLETGEVTLVSRRDGASGAPFDGNSAQPAISADGRRVAFVQASAGGFQQVYVRDVPSGRTFTVSQPNDPAAGPLGNGNSDLPSISDDGLRVAFQSVATNLVGADDIDAQLDVFVRELDTGRTLLVDRAAGAGAKADAAAANPSISGDGRFVAFDTKASNLIGTDDTNNVPDVYVRGLDDGSIRRASVDGAGNQGLGGDAIVPSLSRDGSRVAFVSSMTNFDAPPNGLKLYVKDLTTSPGALTLVGRADGADGAAVTSVSSATLGGGGPVLSADGRHVVFTAVSVTSIAPGAPGDGVFRVYERDIASGVTRLISRRSGAGGAALPGATASGITADGGCVTFLATGLAAPSPGSSDFSNTFLRAVIPNCGRPIPPAGGGGGGGGGAPQAAVLSHLSVRPGRFYVGGRKGGTKIAFRLDKGSSVTLAFDRLLAGHLKGKRCLTTVHKGRHCTVVKRAGHVTVAHGRAGANTVKFSGKLGRHALAVGTYRLTATPLHGKTHTVRFVVVKAPKPKRKGH